MGRICRMGLGGTTKEQWEAKTMFDMSDSL